jgi:hypothetical protein
MRMNEIFSISTLIKIGTLLVAVKPSRNLDTDSISNFQLFQKVFPPELHTNSSTNAYRMWSPGRRFTPMHMDLNLKLSLQATSYSRNLESTCHHLYRHTSWREEVCRSCIGDIMRQNIVVKANNLSQSMNLSHSSVSFDGNIIYSHYLYSSSGFLVGSPVCVVGFFLPTSIIAILLMNPNSKVVYISLQQADIRADFFYEDLRQLQFTFRNFYLHQKEEDEEDGPDCTTLHILGLVNTLEELQYVFHRLPSSTMVRNIIWERLYQPFESYLGKDIRFRASRKVEFDSVGRWFSGKSDYSRNYERNDGTNTFHVTCNFNTGYQFHLNNPVEVYVGTVHEQILNDGGGDDCGSHSLSSGVQDSMFFITYESSMFIETGEGIAEALRRAGLVNVEVMGRFNRTTYLRLRLDYHCPGSLVQISIGGDGLHVLTKMYVLFHTENSWGMFSQQEHYAHIVRHAAAVVVYSTENVRFIQTVTGRESGIFLIPMFSRVPLSTMEIWNHREKETISNDVLSLLSFSERREVFLNQLHEAASKDNISFILPTYIPSSSSNSSSMGEGKLDFSDVQTRDFLTVHSKIFVNIHQHGESVLETHRVNTLLSLGVCVVSEYSTSDRLLDDQYADTVFFVSTFEELYATVKALLASEAMLKSCYKKSLEKFAQLMSDTDGLLAALTYAHNNS